MTKSCWRRGDRTKSSHAGAEMITSRKVGEMIRRSLLACGAITSMGLALAAGDAVAQSAKDLVGTWTVVSAPGIGPNPMGMVMFDANGRFLQLLLRPDLP